MLEGLGNWLRSTQKEKWPHFLFFGGDQIYSDEIGLGHGEKIARARFAARIPGPVDPRPLRDKLVDGAWAGRFAHRFHAYKDPDPAFAGRIDDQLKKLDEIHKQHPALKAIADHYPDIDRKAALKKRHETLKNRRLLNGAQHRGVRRAPDPPDARGSRRSRIVRSPGRALPRRSGPLA